jgi:acyl-CoA dehydrogenase
VASSDATNLRGSIRKEGGKVIVNARKWVRRCNHAKCDRLPFRIPQWISGAGDPRNKIHILIGKSASSIRESCAHAP